MNARISFQSKSAAASSNDQPKQKECPGGLTKIIPADGIPQDEYCGQAAVKRK
jgi:hypothetical protein